MIALVVKNSATNEVENNSNHDCISSQEFRYTYYITFQTRQRNMQRLSTITIPITQQKLDLQENRYRYKNRVDATVIKLTHI